MTNDDRVREIAKIITYSQTLNLTRENQILSAASAIASLTAPVSGMTELAKRLHHASRFINQSEKLADLCGIAADEIDRLSTAPVHQTGTLTETASTVANWATETFGEVRLNASIVARANREMAELIQALATDDDHPKAAEEAADVIICLMRLFARRNTEMQTEIDRKMLINRRRKWQIDGDGHGSHIKEDAT